MSKTLTLWPFQWTLQKILRSKISISPMEINKKVRSTCQIVMKLGPPLTQNLLYTVICLVAVNSTGWGSIGGSSWQCVSHRGGGAVVVEMFGFSTEDHQCKYMTGLIYMHIDNMPLLTSWFLFFFIFGLIVGSPRWILVIFIIKTNCHQYKSGCYPTMHASAQIPPPFPGGGIKRVW